MLIAGVLIGAVACGSAMFSIYQARIRDSRDIAERANARIAGLDGQLGEIKSIVDEVAAGLGEGASESAEIAAAVGEIAGEVGIISSTIAGIIRNNEVYVKRLRLVIAGFERIAIILGGGNP